MSNEMFDLKVTEDKKAWAVLIHEYEQNSGIDKKWKAVARGCQKKEANRWTQIQKSLQIYLHKQWGVSGEWSFACVETERD